MIRPLLLLFVVSTAFAQYTPSGPHFSTILSPGWTWLQDTPPLIISGGVVVDSCVATASTCTFPVLATTSGSVAAIILGTTNNVTISSVTGGGGWTHCAACHLFDAAGFNWDIAYSTTLSAGTTSVTVNLTGAAGGTTSDLFYANFIELLPPAGFSGQFDVGNTLAEAACTSCVGVNLGTLGGTDAIIQATTGGPNVGFNLFGSPYFTEYLSNAGNLTAIQLNATSGAGPTLAQATSAAVDWTAIAFKSTAGSFTPPTPVFSLVSVASTVNDGLVYLSCSPTCSLTVPSTGSGHLLFLQVSNPSGNFLSSATGGGTWVVPTGASTCQLNQSGSAVSCGYVLSSTSSATTINLTMSASATYGVMYYEVSRTSGSFVLDTQASTGITGTTSTTTGQALTLSGTNDVIFQELSSLATNIPLAQSLYPQPLLKTSQGQIFANDKASTGVLLNTKNGTAPKYLMFATGQAAAVSAVAFK
jgi:hypothetical protein